MGIDGDKRRNSSRRASAAARAASPVSGLPHAVSDSPGQNGEQPSAPTQARPGSGIERAGTPARSVGFTLSSLGHAVARHFKGTLAPLQLEPREFALLRTIAPSEGASQQSIAERLQIPASRMVAFVDALEARGLLERRANPEDRRARALYLTDAGRELLGRAFALASEFERHLCARLSESEREWMLDALQRIGAELGVAPGAHAAHQELGGAPPTPSGCD